MPWKTARLPLILLRAGQPEGDWEELYPVDFCKKRAQEVENIILFGAQCTPGPEQVSRVKTTDVSTLNLDQAKPGWPARTCLAALGS